MIYSVVVVAYCGVPIFFPFWGIVVLLFLIDTLVVFNVRDVNQAFSMFLF